MSRDRVLIVDDEENIVTSLQSILGDEGYDISTAGDGVDALEKIQSDPPDLVLLDIWLPGMDGIEVLKTVKSYNPDIEVLIMSGHGTIDTAVKATKLGAYDFIEKPFSLDSVIQSVSKALKLKKARVKLKKADPSFNKQDLPLCFELMVEVKKAVKNAAKNTKPVLVSGEAGTGKEFIAHTIHHQSKQSDLPFLKMNCAVLSMPKIQSELFLTVRQKEKSSSKKSKAASSPKRVVFLKNIDALSKTVQEKIYRGLKNDPNKKNGSSDFLPVRVYASSSRNLEDLVNKGHFSKDLYDCLKSQTIVVPPLREYTANIPTLVKSYFEEKAHAGDLVYPHIGNDVMEALGSYNWPNNIKELRSALDQIIRKSMPDGEVTLKSLPLKIQKAKSRSDAMESDQTLTLGISEHEKEKEFLIHHLRKANWDINKTCKVLKTAKKSFLKKLKEFQIEIPVTNNKLEEPHHLQRTLKRSVVLCGRGLHSGIKTGLILQPLPPGSGVIFGDISTGTTIEASLDNVESTEYSTSLRQGFNSVGTVEHIMAVLHMYRITNLLIKIGDEAPVMDGSAKDFCELMEDGEFEEQDGLYKEIVIDKTYTFRSRKNGGAFISIEPSDTFKVSYHMEYPKPIGTMDYTFEFDGHEIFKKEIAPARTFGFLKDVAELTKMGFATGGKLDNFILLGDNKVLNTELRYEDEFVRHKILDIIGDFYLLGRPIRGYIKAHKSGHTQNIGLLKQIQADLS